MLPVKLKIHSSPYHNNTTASITGSNIRCEVSAGNRTNWKTTGVQREGAETSQTKENCNDRLVQIVLT